MADRSTAGDLTLIHAAGLTEPIERAMRGSPGPPGDTPGGLAVA